MEQLSVLWEQLETVFFQALDRLVGMNMTTGTLMFLGGLAGIVISLLAILISLAVFPGQRKRMLKKLAE